MARRTSLPVPGHIGKVEVASHRPGNQELPWRCISVNLFLDDRQHLGDELPLIDQDGFRLSSQNGRRI